MSICEKPLSTTTSASDEKKVISAISPTSGISSRATTIETTICNRMVPSFSPRLHATPLATLSRNSPPIPRYFNCARRSSLRRLISPIVAISM